MQEPTTRQLKRIAKTRYGPVLETCRDVTIAYVDAQIAELFKHCNPVLLDFAERAENNALQGRFFEAISLLKNREADIVYTFRVEINQGFDRFARTGRLLQEESEHAPDGFELSLVEQDDMEESVACENLTLRANASFFPDLFALAQRFSVVNGGVKLKDSEVPASPHHLVQSFHQAIHSLDVEPKIKVILYALFERFVINNLGQVYDELNEHLKQAGILPNLKPVPVRKGSEKAPEPRKPKSKDDRKGADAKKAPGEAGEGSLANELFDSIIGLMSKRHPGAADNPAEYGMDKPPSPELLNAINKVQTDAHPPTADGGPPTGVEIPTVEIDAAFLGRVKDTLTQERQQILDKVDKDDLLPVDSDLIDLIGMLFEYMLNDPVLPNSAKALLSHLHTPYLKVALTDRRMLVDNRHPARRLLDQMIEGGSLWIEEGNQSRGIFPAMRKAVDRVLLEFTDDIGLFDELLADFEAAMQEQRRRMETMEQRSQDSARGRERLQLARQQAIEQIQGISPHPLPRAVSTFLNKVWVDHLVFVLLRDSDRSEAWKQAVSTAEALADLFSPKMASASSGRLQANGEQLRGEIGDQVQAMDDIHRQAIDDLFALLGKPPKTWLQGDMAEVAIEPRDVVGGAIEGATPGKAMAGEEEDDTDLSPEEKGKIEELRKLRFGTWLELMSDEDGKPRRVKLSWMSPLTSTCMFVDRSGMQAEVKTLRDLARAMLAGRAKIVPPPKHAFIDRALMSIRKVLGSDKETGSPAAMD